MAATRIRFALVAFAAASLLLVDTTAARAGGPMVSGFMYTGTITPGGGSETWTFAANSGDAIVLRTGEISSSGGNFAPRIQLEGPGGLPTWTSTTYADAAELIATAPTPGTYKVMVNNASGITATGTYRLTLAKSGDQAGVSQGDEGGPLTNGVTCSGMIQLGDLDVWTVSASAGEAIVVRMGQWDAQQSLNPHLRIYGPGGGGAIAANGFSLAAEVAITASISGMYMVVADDGAGQISGTGGYRITLAKTGSLVGTSFWYDEGGVLEAGASRIGDIELGDLDVWSASALAGESIPLKMESLSSWLYPSLRIYSPAGARLADLSGTSGTTITWPGLAAVEGQYLIVAGGAGGGLSSTGNYRLSRSTPCFSPPSYDPSVWNGRFQHMDNCYSYAVNQQTGTNAQPGRAHGLSVTREDVSSVIAGAEADGLVPTTKEGACPCGHKVAGVSGTVLRAGRQIWDFHWLRQDRDGTWSQKLGNDGIVTNLDANNRIITDPEHTSFGYAAPGLPQYAHFVGYFCVTPTTRVSLTANDDSRGSLQEREAGDGSAATVQLAFASNTVEASPITMSGLPDTMVVLSGAADLDTVKALLSELATAPDPQWPPILGYRRMRLNVVEVPSLGTESIRVWNGVLEVEVDTTRVFYVDSKGLEAWLFRRILGLATTAVAPVGPTGLRLGQPRPNPFSRSTTISLDLDAEAIVSARVLDIAGRVIRHLVNARMSAGSHALIWDGLDDDGRALRSGTYFVRTSIEGVPTAHRMVVLLGP